MRLLVQNTKSLRGEISINGAKNAVLPIIAASLLCDSSITLSNVPDLIDVHLMSTLLKNLGAEINFIRNKEYKGNHTLKINCSNINKYIASSEIVSRIRASFLILGPMLSRFGKVKTALPGGCNIGNRPINMHISALEKMGAKIEIEGSNITAMVKERLHGKEITFEKVSVGATENIIIAATLADGVTKIYNPAVDPEVLDLIKFLTKMGANISIYNDEIIIKGVERLNGCTHKIIPDRIEAGTYALAAVVTDGELKLKGISLSDIRCIEKELKIIGAKIESTKDGITVFRQSNCINPISVVTNSYPNFPTDMQPQLMSVVCFADGISTIQENIYDNRLTHVSELKKTGANINIERNKATVIGTRKLSGSNFNTKDLRSTAGFILTSLAASGESIINNSNYLCRGYEAMHEKLNLCGANILVLI
ncbi:UDP-N-acetylglucosamine 1-carboxyvinyltransferase [Wolbachia endosymbiont of Pentidionis agamae]|uniref:UDP-N-acetylglucosamine 1-carboxyvinyltransferase n=1 Tax=Wolbachia endosymbiont of Pentidionis agamae TaxID=3110435 RepID=UPI002FD51F6D